MYATPGIFSALDVQVTLIEPRDTFLDFVDREIIDDFVHQLRDRGMTIRLGTGVASVERDESVHLSGQPDPVAAVPLELLQCRLARVPPQRRSLLGPAGVLHRDRIGPVGAVQHRAAADRSSFAH